MNILGILENSQQKNLIKEYIYIFIKNSVSLIISYRSIPMIAVDLILNVPFFGFGITK